MNIKNAKELPEYDGLHNNFNGQYMFATIKSWNGRVSGRTMFKIAYSEEGLRNKKKVEFCETKCEFLIKCVNF